MDVSLDGLEKWLSDLDDQFPAKPADLKLKGHSFDRSSNESLGLSGQASDFTVFMPSNVLSLRNKDPDFISKELKAFPSTTQKAFKDVVDTGLKRKDTDTVLIDIATLAPEMQYFLQGGDASVIRSLAGLVKGLEGKKVVIRLLVGDEKIVANNDEMDKRWDLPEDYGKSLKKRYEEIFWSTDFKHEAKASPQYTPIFEYSDVTLYVGYYCPDFRPNDKDESIKDVKVFLNKIVKASLESKAGKVLTAFYRNLNIDELVNKVIVNQARSITWNHGKVLAVNGATLMTGGINYWDLYANNGPHDICDTAVKVQGDAAISAHRWADYFWNYLENLKAKGTDRSSFWRKANLSKPPSWEHGGTIPNSLGFKKRITEKKFETLTVARLGDWFGGMQPIRYPVQVIDAMRDVILNAAWQHAQQMGLYRPFLSLAGFPFDGYLSDDYLSSNEVQYFQELGISPLAWASRSARTKVITSATHSVVICQQMLVEWLQNSDKNYQAVVKGINDKLKLSVDNAWHGSIWPFDLLIALAHALCNMSRSQTPNLHSGGQDFGKDSKGIYIVLTTNNTEGPHGDWDDRVPIWEIKDRLKTIMNVLPYSYGGVDFDKIDPLLDSMVHFKRTGTPSDQKGEDLYSHSKIVCVDRKLMYVGSDNTYPCYNEEHGVWIEDQPTINTWLDGFFVDYWKTCKTPSDLKKA